MRSALVALLLAPAAFAQVPVRAFPIAEPRVVSLASGDLVAIAAGREQFLAAWRDQRVAGSPARIWAARISADGLLLDPRGIPLGEAVATDHPWPFQQPLIDVASNGEDYLVAWPNEDRRLTTAAVTRDGRRGDVYQHDDIRMYELALVAFGNHYAAVYLDARQPSAVRVAVLDDRGQLVVEPQTVVQLDAGPRSIAAAVGKAETELMIAFADPRNGGVTLHAIAIADLLAARVPQVPHVGAAPWIELPYGVSIAAGANNYMLAWIERVGDQQELRARCTGSNVIIRLNPSHVGSRPVVVGEGGEFAILYDDASTSRATLFSSCGATPLTVLLHAGPGTSRDAAARSRTAYVWSDRGVVRAALAGDTRTTTISMGYADRTHVQAVWIGDHYLATWREGRAMYGRFTADGRLLDGAGVPLGSGEPTEVAPQVASSGDGALVGWMDDRAAHLAFIARDGRVTRVLDVETTLSPRPVFVHWNGAQYVAMWGTSAVRVDRHGTLLDPQPVTVSHSAIPLGLAWTGERYVRLSLAFGCHICDPEVVATTFSSELVRDDRAQFVATNPPQVRIADSPAGGALVVWARGNVVEGKRLDRSGSVIDHPVPLRIGEASYVSDVEPARDGWTVLSGRDVFHVKHDGTVTRGAYAFVPPRSASILVHGGPVPLVVFRVPAFGAQEAASVLARPVIPQRQRSVR